MEDARTIELFGKNIPVRKYGCKNQSCSKPCYITVPRVNIFIQTTNLCNANCKFCIYHCNEKKTFDVEKLGKILKTISSMSNVDIGKLNYTGGEPTLDMKLFDEIVGSCISNLDLKRKPEVTLNTNGISLMEVLKYEDFIDSIGLSRHHYDDKTNADIFGTTSVATSEEIKTFMGSLRHKNIMQLRCNLIKGFIDTYEKVSLYMDKAMELGVHDCGFVTLTPNNDYCKNHQIDFNSLIYESKDILKVNAWDRLDESNDSYCKCANYVYSNVCGDMCKFYSRLFCRNDNKEGMLVYDGQNLRYGFGGEIIY